MKQTPKRLIAALLCVVTLLGCCTTAAAAATKPTPVIVVGGVNASPLVNQDTGKNAFPFENDVITTAVLKLLLPLGLGVTADNWALMEKYGVYAIDELFAGMACDLDGNSVENVEAVTYPGSIAKYQGDFNGDVCRAIANRIGEKNVYFFCYDWRMSPLDHADDLQKTIKQCMKETGSKKVSLVAMSMGGCVTSAYLYKYGSSKLKNVVYGSTAMLGTRLVPELFMGNLDVSLSNVLTYFRAFMSDNEILGFFIDNVSKVEQEFGAQAITAIVDGLQQVLKSALFKDIFKNVFTTFPSIWALIPTEDYEDCKKNVNKHIKLSKSFIKKTDEYVYKVESKLESLINKAVKNGVNVYITGAYGYTSIPVTSERPYQTDTLIDTDLMTGGAAVARYGKTIKNTKRVCSSGHSHLSADGLIDASTGILPERTWIIKNLGHVQYFADNDAGKFIAWLCTRTKGVNIRSNKKYPQFMQINNETGEMFALSDYEQENSQTVQQSITSGLLSMISELFARAVDFIKARFSA